MMNLRQTERNLAMNVEILVRSELFHRRGIRGYMTPFPFVTCLVPDTKLCIGVMT
jgi:hypothetical protein